MTITSSSNIADIRNVAETPVLGTADDIANWQTLSLPTDFDGDNTGDFTLGLFGYDMTDFWTNCYTSTSCTANTTVMEADFDGWSFGANIVLSGTLANSSMVVACIEGEYSCFGFIAATTDTVTDAFNWNFGPSWAFSTTYPDTSNITTYYLENYDTGYGFIAHWWAAPTYYSEDTYVSFNNFMNVNSNYKVELADTDTAWVISNDDTDLNDNTSTDIVWAGSASLAIPAAIVLAALTTL